MATLGNLLQRRGGSAMTPRVVKLTLALPDPQGGAPTPTEADIALLPLSLTAEGKARRAAEAYVMSRREFGDAPDLPIEYLFQFAVAAMRDPDDLRRAFVDAKSVDTFRGCLVGEQLDVLIREYRELIRSEYSEVISDKDGIKDEATALFPKAPV